MVNCWFAKSYEIVILQIARVLICLPVVLENKVWTRRRDIKHQDSVDCNSLRSDCMRAERVSNHFFLIHNPQSTFNSSSFSLRLWMARAPNIFHRNYSFPESKNVLVVSLPFVRDQTIGIGTSLGIHFPNIKREQLFLGGTRIKSLMKANF